MTISQKNVVVQVTWDRLSPAIDNQDGGGVMAESSSAIACSGRLRVVTAATYAFSEFIVPGYRFQAQGVMVGATSWGFTYSGSRPMADLQAILVPGCSITLTN